METCTYKEKNRGRWRRRKWKGVRIKRRIGEDRLGEGIRKVYI